jgi:hypothetical protein
MQHLDADPDFVQTQAAAITAAAGEIQDASRQLHTVSAGGFQSLAVDAFETNIQQLTSVLNDAWMRYADTGNALTNYAPVLRRVQEEIDAAIGVVSHTDVNGAAYHAEVTDMQAVTNSLNPFASDSDKDEANLAAARAKAHLEQQLAAVSTAQANYDTAMAELKAAAKVAAQQIENGIEMSRLNDKFWDHVQQVMDDIHKFLTKALALVDRILSDLSTALTIIGAIVVIIGILTLQPEVVAAGLLVLDAATAATVLDTDVKTLQFLNGDISFGDLMSGVIIAIASVLLGKLGGKVVDEVGAKMGAKAFSKLFSKGMQEVDIDSANFAVGTLRDDALDKANDPLARFIDQHVGISGPVNSYLSQGQWQVPYTTKDVGQLSPDFSNISVQNIMNSAMSDAPQTSPMLTTVSLSVAVA